MHQSEQRRMHSLVFWWWLTIATHFCRAQSDWKRPCWHYFWLWKTIYTLKCLILASKLLLRGNFEWCVVSQRSLQNCQETLDPLTFSSFKYDCEKTKIRKTTVQEGFHFSSAWFYCREQKQCDTCCQLTKVITQFGLQNGNVKSIYRLLSDSDTSINLGKIHRIYNDSCRPSTVFICHDDPR